MLPSLLPCCLRDCLTDRWSEVSMLFRGDRHTLSSTMSPLDVEPALDAPRLLWRECVRTRTRSLWSMMLQQASTRVE